MKSVRGIVGYGNFIKGIIFFEIIFSLGIFRYFNLNINLSVLNFEKWERHSDFLNPETINLPINMFGPKSP